MLEEISLVPGMLQVVKYFHRLSPYLETGIRAFDVVSARISIHELKSAENPEVRSNSLASSSIFFRSKR